MAFVIFGFTALAWKVSAEREVRYRMPEPDRFFPSRKYAEVYVFRTISNTDPNVSWSRQIIEHEKAKKNITLFAEHVLPALKGA